MADFVDRTGELTPNDSDVVLINTADDEYRQEEEETRHDCGLGACRPSWMQSCANIRLFTILMCILGCINGSISASYLPSVITSIERRFEFGSSITGLIVGSYEIGATIAVIFVSYIGNRKNIPVIIALGTILVGTGTCLFALPHFIAPPYSTLVNEAANRTLEDACLNELSHSAAYNDKRCKAEDLKSGTEIYVIIFLIAQTCIGVGSTPILTIGLSYIDTHVTRKKSPQYLAFVYAASTLGPVMGFGVGAALTEIYVDFANPSVIAIELTPTDSQWVGAWWVGFLIFGGLTMMSALPIFAFPKSLPDPYKVYGTKLESLTEKKELSDSQSCEFTDINRQNEKPADSHQWSSFKKFPQAVMKLLKNPIYMLLNLTTIFEMVIVTGFITFMPKYLETQFDLRTSEANLYTGALAIPGAALGILSSGALLKKLKLTIKGALQFTLILAALGLAAFSLAFILGCDNTVIAGITVPYYKSSESTDGKLTTQNLTSSCNSDCTCIDTIYTPVCGHNLVTYFSACHAGCRVNINGTAEDCACIDDDMSAAVDLTDNRLIAGQATEGVCPKNCHTLIPFMILVLALCFFLAALKTPMTTIIMRSVDDDLRAFSLGIQMVLIRTCALLPAPVMFGSTIDTTCLWWKYECEKRKNCLLYDVESFRYKLLAISSSLHFLALLTFLLAWYIVKRREDKATLARTTSATQVQRDSAFETEKSD